MGRPASLTLAVVVLGLLLPAACKDEQPQLVLVMDTDLVLPRQLAADATLSRAASFDRIRIEMLTDQGLEVGTSGVKEEPTKLTELYRTIVITPETVWPLTLGIRASEDGYRTARLRIRAYRSDSLVSGAASYDIPSKTLTLDRLVSVTVPTDHVERVRVVLAGDCMGTESDSATSFQTCVTGPDDMQDASEGVERLGAEIPASVAGTWPRARVTPCAKSPPNADAVCIPGGLFVRGDTKFEENVDSYVSSLPRHIVHVRPFFLDRREVTVRRFRGLVARGVVGSAMPRSTSAADPLCTWSSTPGALEDRPLNCVTSTLARAACVAAGGALPTDAQWEHAARGRQSGAFVWGDATPTCCAARFATPFGCAAVGAEGTADVGSFVDPARCEGRADVSTDGVFDLTGNVREIVQDSWVFYGTDECPRRAVAEDPLCVVPRGRALARGGSFRSTFDQAKIPARSRADASSDDLGFRCAYPSAGDP